MQNSLQGCVHTCLEEKQMSTDRSEAFRPQRDHRYLCAAIGLLMAFVCGCGSSPGSASLSATSFNFGDNLVNNTLTQTVVSVTNTGSGTLTMQPGLTGDSSYAIVASQSCGTTLPAHGTCKMVVSYDPKVASAPNAQTAVLNMGFQRVSATTPQTVSITGTSAQLAAGQVTVTDNPQVALYTMTLPFQGTMSVQFGPTTSYGLSTWQQSAGSSGGQVSIFVAGMKASSTYHMAATVQFANGITATDPDHTFTTGAASTNPLVNPTLTTSTSASITPQSGLELLNPLGAVLVTDLSGNILWRYLNPGTISNNNIQGVKMLPNGDILMAIGRISNAPLNSQPPAGTYDEIREVNLGGDTVRSITISQLNTELQSATCAECNVVLQTFHHDVTALPNGHWLVIANTLMDLSSTTQPPLTNTPPQTVLGDVIVDLDSNLQPVWAWNEFNHLDPNRHPMAFPDWTHTNAVIYSADDGNLLISMRHQNWVVKVDYSNGTGTGKILWHLGQGGDFGLAGGTAPTDWQYAQHAPSFVSSNTTGVFSLVMMDNGDDRQFASGVSCGTTGEPSCQYSTVPVFQIDENAKTATLLFHQIVPTAQYNVWGGNAETLSNGDVEYDLCGVASQSFVYEVTNEQSPQTVWSMTSNANLYRAFRIPSFYPGVQW